MTVAEAIEKLKTMPANATVEALLVNLVVKPNPLYNNVMAANQVAQQYGASQGKL